MTKPRFSLSALALLLTCLACTAEVEQLDDKTRPTADLAAPFEGITPHRADRPGSLASGYLAVGGPEDLVLASENGRYLFERNKDNDFQDPVPDESWILPGALVDAVGTSGGTDKLIGLTTTIATTDGKVRPIAFDKVEIAKGTQGGAVLATATIKLEGGDVEITTRAVLARDLPHIVLRTRVVNRSERAVALRVGDRLVFGPGTIFGGPSGARTSAGQTKVPYLTYEGLPEAYAYTIDGKKGFTAAFHVADHGSRSNTTGVDTLSDPTTLQPGKDVEFVRRFRASGKGMPGVRAWLADLADQQVGTVQGKIIAPRGLEPSRFRIQLFEGNKLFGHLTLDSDLTVNTPIPAGTYRVVSIGPWGLTAPPTTLEVKSGKTTRIELDFGGLDTVKVSVRDARSKKSMPATLVVTTLDDKPVMLGRGDEGLNGGPYLHLPTGSGELRLPAGKYKVIATRGPEYTIDVQELRVQAGRDDNALTATLDRRLNTDGLLRADLRVYSQLDSVGYATLPDMAEAMVASGVELAAVTNRRAPIWLEDAATPLGLNLAVRSLPGQEGAPTWPDYGTFTLLPAGNPGAGRAGVPLANTQPEPFFEELRKLGSGKPFVTVTWPRNPSKSGYFDIYSLDRDTGLFTKTGGSYNFDGIEVLSGGALATDCMMTDPKECTGDGARIAEALDDASRDWAALVTQGYKFTATASSGASRPGLEPVGMPFTWIDVGRKNDDTTRLDPRKAVEALRDNQAVVSTGPVVRFTIEGRNMGQLAPGLKRIQKGDKLIVVRGARVDIEVTAMDWVGFTEVVLYEDGVAKESWEVAPVPKDDVVSFKTSVTVAPTQDSWYHVRVYGRRQLVTVPHLPVRSFALTNPIWVDGDGDGKWERNNAVHTLD